MEETLARRGDPRALWPEVRSIIVLAMNYGPDARSAATILDKQDRGAISVYAQNRDYHDVIKGKLKGIAGKLAAQDGRRRQGVRRYRAGHGKAAGRGRRHRLAGQAHQSGQPRVRLLAVPRQHLHDRRDRAATAEDDHCGSCRACLDACPTNAFPAPYRLDARRCISYLTIENKGPIPHEFREAIGNRIYGCDDCLAACPWNKFARAASEAKLQARDELREPRACRSACARRCGVPGAVFRLAGQAHRPRPLPAQRADRGRQFRRPALADACLALLGDASPLVRGAAVWALSLAGRPAGLCGARRTGGSAGAATREVLAEWRSATCLRHGCPEGRGVIRNVFIFGAGYSGKALRGAPRSGAGDRRHDAFARTGSAALERAGIEPLLFDGRGRRRAGGQAPAGRRRHRVDPPRRGRRPGAEAARDGSPAACRACAGSAICRPSASMATMAAPGWTRRAHAARCPAARVLRARSRAGLAGHRPRQPSAGRGPPALRHLRAGPQRLRQSRDGTARRLVKPGQVFNRIHVDDIAGALWHLPNDRPWRRLQRHRRSAGAAAGCRRLCRRLMGVEPPPEMPFETAELSPMARSFYGENKRVSNAAHEARPATASAFPTTARRSTRCGRRQAGRATAKRTRAARCRRS